MKREDSEEERDNLGGKEDMRKRNQRESENSEAERYFGRR